MIGRKSGDEKVYGIEHQFKAHQDNDYIPPEQNAHQALMISSHSYVMESGKIVLEGSAKQLMADQAVIDSYLGQVQPSECPK